MRARQVFGLEGVVLNELVQGRLKEGKETYAFFLDVQKAYDSVTEGDKRLPPNCLEWSVIRVHGDETVS